MVSMRTPLNHVHRALGARMVDFAGWDMPVQYSTGIIAEHTAVRSGCGVFDLSHMGRVFLSGPDAMRLAQLCATRDLRRIRPGEAAYSVLCLPDGGILDDVIACELAPDEVLFVVNASNREVDLAWFSDARDRQGLQVTVEDRTLETALIGVQGPSAQATLQPLCTAELEALPGYAFLEETRVIDRPAMVSRTGYTGEDGFELMVAAEDAEPVWNALLGDRSTVIPCGLGARDTLRTEAGFALYGHEIDEHTNPYEARLGWVVHLDKPEFIGREALLAIKQAGPRRRLVGLHIGQGGVPRPGFPILADTERPVGALTSGTFSPSLKRNIGMGYVPVDLSHPGQQVGVQLRSTSVPAEVTKLPFVPQRSRPRASM
jgi:aminomethyltransferase